MLCSLIFFFKQKTAYELRISDWSSDVCSSDLAWDGGKFHLPLLSFIDGQPFGKPNAGVDMTFDFGRLLAHAAMTRPPAAGSIIGSGTDSNRDADGGPGRPIADGEIGRVHVWPPVTNADTVCRLLLETQNTITSSTYKTTPVYSHH